MVLPHQLCSHLQNAFRAHHAKAAFPHTTQNLGVLSVLLRAGFISSITRGSVATPLPHAFERASIVDRRIWADLKYRNERPVLSAIHLVSMPSKAIYMDVSELRRLCSGRGVQSVHPLKMGEIAVVRTRNKEHEWLEAREALQLNLGGEIVCRAH